MSGIQTCIVRVEGEHADNLTTTTAPWNFLGVYRLFPSFDLFDPSYFWGLPSNFLGSTPLLFGVNQLFTKP